MRDQGGAVVRVFIGVDPHKLSVTIEVVDRHERVLATGRFATDNAGYRAMRKHVTAWPERTWAVEGSNGAGRRLAQRLLADGEQVVDVPAKLSARARLFDTGHNRKTDAHDAHSVAVVAVRTPGLRVLSYDAELEALRMLVDRRDQLRPRPCLPRSARGTWSVRPAAAWPRSCWPSWSWWRRRSRSCARSSRRWFRPAARR
ncbi:transposase [Nostocoides sp. F2B08]|uniref:IS110 family transposase n=1 Tax=Nostocoides sp. F2B08 TaxID=2653936 RepID=UPI00351A9CDD